MSDLSSHVSLVVAELKSAVATHTNEIKRRKELLDRTVRELQEAEAAYAAIEAVQDKPGADQ